MRNLTGAKMSSNNRCQNNFRMYCKRHVAPLRTIQITSLFTSVLSVLIAFFGMTLGSSFCLIFRYLAVLGVIGELYAFARIKEIKCPKCKQSLGYLFSDPNYSGTSGLVFPKELPSDIKSCPYCHVGFE